jgi:type II secretory pathway pseudopilin PulG
MKVKGFTLIECLVYCAIASCLSMMIFTFFNRTVTGIRQFSAHQHDMVAQWSAQQLLHKDIQTANNEAINWDISASLFVCKIGTDSIGWHSDNHKLYRTKGIYDFIARRWLKKSVSLVAQNIERFDCAADQNQTIIEGVSYHLCLGTYQLHKKIPLISTGG